VIDVPVPANAPPGRGAPATVIPVVPGPGTGSGTGTSPGGGAGTPGTSGGAVPGAISGGTRTAPPSAVPPAPVVIPAIPPHPGPFRVQRQRSLSEMANEQLRRGKPKDPLAEGMEGAAIDDCLHAPTKPDALGGLLAAPSLALRALGDRCAK
jgi:hypothetical protein